MRFGRRELFRFGAAGGAFALLGAAGEKALRRFGARPQPATPAPAGFGLDCGTQQDSLYGARFLPPPYLPPGSRDALHCPPAPRARASTELQVLELPMIETTLEVANGRNARVWAYAGSVPGPILRATVGERLRVRVTNHTSIPHSLHFHGTHELAEDGLQRIAPGQARDYELTAGPVGFHPYHCHVPPYACHIGRGMYGGFIVDPEGGRPPAHEFVLCLCGFDTTGKGQNDTYAWNGVAGYYERFPIKVPVGELVRLYIMNMVENDSVASFHLHAQSFDLYRSGTSLTPHEHTDMVSLGPAERSIVEFRLPRRGRYMFHPHQSHMAERGAMGFIAAV